MALNLPSRGNAVDPALLEALRRTLLNQPQQQPMPGRVTLPAAVTPIVNTGEVVAPGPGRAPEQQKVDVTKFDFGEPPPPPEPKYITDMERVSAEMPKPSYADAWVREDGSVRGATYHDKAPALPDFKTHAVEPMDSNVIAPDGPTTEPGRVTKVGAMRPVPRKAGETEAQWRVRQRAEYREALRDESPYSKVTKTDEGVDVAPPVKPGGIKGRGRAALAMGSRLIAAGRPYGLAGTAGSSLVGLLTGLFAPGYEAKIERSDQLAAADKDIAGDEEQAGRDQQRQLREAQLAEVQNLPGRREDAAKELQRDNLRQIWAGLSEFDPTNNQEHHKLQTDAALLGILLPAKQPKPTRSTTRTGLLAHTKTVADAQGNKYYVDEETGAPILDPQDATGRTLLYADRVKPEPPDTAGENAQIRTEAERSREAGLEREARKKAEEFGAQAIKAEADLAKLDTEIAAFGANVKAVDMTAAQKETVARATKLRSDVKQYRASESTWWNKRAEHDIKRETLPNLKVKPGRKAQAGGAYAGKKFPIAAVQAWATAHQMTLDQAKALFTREGATIQ